MALTTPSDERIDLREPVAQICRELGLDPNYVAELIITPDSATATVYRGRDGRFKGYKYVDESGKTATETLSFRIRS